MFMSSAHTTSDKQTNDSSNDSCSPLLSMQRSAADFSRMNAQILKKKDSFEYVAKVLRNSLVDLEDIGQSITTCSNEHIDTRLLKQDIDAIHCDMKRASAVLNRALDPLKGLSPQTKTIMLQNVVHTIVVRILLKISAVHHTMLFKGSMPYDNHHVTAKVANFILSLSHAADILHRIPHNRNSTPTEENANLFNAAAMSAQTVYESLYSLRKVVKKEAYNRIVCCYTLIEFTSRLLSKNTPVDSIESLRLCSSITMNSAGVLAHKIADEDLLTPSFIPTANSLKKIIISSVCVHVDIMEGCARCKELGQAQSYYSYYNKIDTESIIDKVTPEARQMKNSLFSKLCRNALSVFSITDKSAGTGTDADAILQRYAHSMDLSQEKTTAESASSSDNSQHAAPSSTLSSPSSSRYISYFTEYI